MMPSTSLWIARRASSPWGNRSAPLNAATSSRVSGFLSCSRSATQPDDRPTRRASAACVNRCRAASARISAEIQSESSATAGLYVERVAA